MAAFMAEMGGDQMMMINFEFFFVFLDMLRRTHVVAWNRIDEILVFWTLSLSCRCCIGMDGWPTKLRIFQILNCRC